MKLRDILTVILLASSLVLAVRSFALAASLQQLGSVIETQQIEIGHWKAKAATRGCT